MRHILAWAATVEVLGLAALPLLRAFFRNRRDAALLSRPLGLALVGWLAGALTMSSGIPFERELLLLASGSVAVVSYALARRARKRESAEADAKGRAPFWGPEETRAALLFWGATGVFLLIRAAGPGILGAEKFMDLAFFNSMTRHEAMPPLDPWMAGKTINYYYWGYLLAAALAKISAVTTYVSYNLAVATFAGYAFVAAVCLGLRLSAGRLAAGLGAGFATVFAGNLAGALNAWKAPLDAAFDYWPASRVIGSGDTINEFPFFTFFHADLHPHLLAFPFFVAAFAVAHRFVERGGPAQEEKPGGWRERLRRLSRALPSAFLLAVAAGTAIAANKWNTPAMGILLFCAGILRVRGRGNPLLGRKMFWGALQGISLFIGALLLWSAYSRSYALLNRGLGKTTATSGILEFLGVWGIFFFPLLLALWPRAAKDEASRRRAGFHLTLLFAICWLFAWFWKTPVLLLLLPLGYLAAREGWKAARSEEGRPLLFTCFLLLLGLAMITGCEFIHFKDNYGEKLHRLNTLFKFYHQAWPLIAVAAAVFLERAWRQWGKEKKGFQAVIAVSIFLSLLYPLNAAVSRLRQREGPFSLDATLALSRRNPADAAAIAWLEKNAPKESVVLEAAGDPYREFARVSSHTGLPTVMGWANHEGLWRANDPEVAEREGLVRRFYSGADPQEALSILQRFGVTYVVVGDLERALYPSAEGVSLYPFLDPVHEGQTTVYRLFGAQ